MSQHIYLTGYRGTGKTSIGKIIAHEIRRPLVDLDEKIESDAGMSIREIFDKGGESLFRDLESTALRLVIDGPPSVISLGGGAIVREENRRLIGETGDCLWLDARADELAARIEGDDSTADRRPALTSQGLIDEIEMLLEQRRPLYQEIATFRIDTSGKSIDQVAEEAVSLIAID